ncbi:winged helix DNA-binding domain-containing protein [Catenuloplanes atrovinosus]|uniref:Winged helix DNA-binding domain-containing protein n=1 Tax=Catenuloplanes atrovinosus TaxID=137266 RepID=A0AAE3YMR7_9ACTN|nr:winged helix DNA-binding domain-containing protein [Catenuloplanes atrovinosus]MDR7276634.1 hypothetical protein [Catenuloplanes atrovinosus]
MRHVSDHERRARLGVRHALAPPFRATTVEDAARAVTVLHATEPPTVYLSCWARMDTLKPDDLDRALHADRTLVKQLAMRRTLFVFPRDLLPFAWPSASARVAATERARLAKDVVTDGLTPDGGAWLDRARAEVLAALDGVPGGRTAQEIRLAVPMIDVKAAGLPVAGRVLNHLGLTADLVRGTNTGGWHVSRPRWTPMADWLGTSPSWPTAADGYREIIRRWLWSFGPGTEDDLVWWLGGTKSTVRAALTTLAAEQVTLDSGRTGWLLPDDLDEVPAPAPWAALLPVLDPTVMGWQSRDFYLGPHRDLIFDTRGNAGTTAWVNGRVVGAWIQDPSGAVRIRLAEPVSAVEEELLHAEARRLTDWLAGFRVSSVYSSPIMKG